MTLDEFVDKIDWSQFGIGSNGTYPGSIRTKELIDGHYYCPLQMLTGKHWGYTTAAYEFGLDENAVRTIMDTADNLKWGGRNSPDLFNKMLQRIQSANSHPHVAESA